MTNGQRLLGEEVGVDAFSTYFATNEAGRRVYLPGPNVNWKAR